MEAPIAEERPLHAGGRMRPQGGAGFFRPLLDLHCRRITGTDTLRRLFNYNSRTGSRTMQAVRRFSVLRTPRLFCVLVEDLQIFAVAFLFQVFLRNKSQGRGVEAISQPRGLRPVVEDVPEMAAAAAAMTLGARIDQLPVGLRADRARQRLPRGENTG